MQARPVRKPIATTLRRAEPPAVHLDDLAPYLGARLAPIRASLDSEPDVAVAMADRVEDGDRCVLVATRSAILVRCLGRDQAAVDERTLRAPWASVRVSPMSLEFGSLVDGTRRYGCEVLVGDERFRVMAGDDGEPAGIQAFHDEIVRRGTPWHYPR